VEDAVPLATGDFVQHSHFHKRRDRFGVRGKRQLGCRRHCSSGGEGGTLWSAPTRRPSTPFRGDRLRADASVITNGGFWASVLNRYRGRLSR